MKEQELINTILINITIASFVGILFMIWLARNFDQIFKWLDRKITFGQIFTRSNLKEKEDEKKR
jgi:hypothetical protein